MNATRNYMHQRVISDGQIQMTVGQTNGRRYEESHSRIYEMTIKFMH
jgi:hypothetical protein